MRFDIYRKPILEVLNDYNEGEVILYPLEETILYQAMNWYNGYVPSVHNYRLYNGKKYNTFQKKRTNIYKKTCEDFASMLINERCDIVIGDEEQQEAFSKLLYKNRFWLKANQGVELSFALGYGFLVEGVKDLKINEKKEIINDEKAKTTIDFVNAEKSMPLIVEDGKITDIAFIKVNTLDTIISIHCKDRRKSSATYGNYFIVNLVLKNELANKRGQYTSLSIKDKYTIYTESDVAWFQEIKPNIVNNYELDNILGLPICWNARDTLASIDNAYDSLDVEINDSKRKTFVSEDLTERNVDSNGNFVNPYDPNDARFYIVPNLDENKTLIQESAPALRVNDIISALNMQLNTYSSKLGMGENYYNFNGRQIATATQVVSENSALFRTLKKHEILIEQALLDFVKAIIHISNTFTEVKFDDIDYDNINIKFDDSIIEDKESEKTSDRQDVSNGVMSNIDYRKKWFAEDEETATKKVGYLDIARMYDTLFPALSNGTMTPSQFVNLVSERFEFINTEGLEDYITEQLASSNQTFIDPFADENTDLVDESNE